MRRLTVRTEYNPEMLRELRGDSSFRGLAARVDDSVSMNTFQNAESGKHDPRLSTLTAIACVFDVRIVIDPDGTIWMEPSRPENERG